jgi:hypothetical protein
MKILEIFSKQWTMPDLVGFNKAVQGHKEHTATGSVVQTPQSMCWLEVECT